MQWTTPVEVPVSNWKISYDDRICLLGSCFADQMARRFDAYYFRNVCNPKGTLYNPISIAQHFHDDYVQDANVLIITFGTAWVYEENGTVVDNCAKRPASCFKRRRLTVAEIVDKWFPILRRFTTKHFIFTVSPIRHVKDGLHENQLSKSILLLAVEHLTSSLPHVHYFPSYEIQLDELRDYRFYADDLKHPSSVAVNYIWDQFVGVYMQGETLEWMRQLHQLWLDRQHRSLHPESEEDRAFQQRLQHEVATLQVRFPWVR